MTDERKLQDIDKQIEALFLERKEILSKMDRQFVEVYTVFNNETGHLDDNTFVLNPLKKRDLEFLQAYAESLKDGVLKLSLEDWLKEYTNFRCIQGRVCQKTGTPVCCAHCSMLQECLAVGDSSLCANVETGEVIVVTDCIDED